MCNPRVWQVLAVHTANWGGIALQIGRELHSLYQALRPYVNHGRFDQIRFERDMARDNEALMQWYAEHPNELDWVGDVTLYPGERKRKAS